MRPKQISEAVDYCISTGTYNESERGMEAIRRVEVENFPAFTIIDDKTMTSSRIEIWGEGPPSSLPG
jgi:tartrate dehydratase beta subunit/fumarate hydratase class I family protein